MTNHQAINSEYLKIQEISPKEFLELEKTLDAKNETLMDHIQPEKVWTFRTPLWWSLLNPPAWLFVLALILVLLLPPLPQNLALLNFIALVCILASGWWLLRTPTHQPSPKQRVLLAVKPPFFAYGSEKRWCWFHKNEILSLKMTRQNLFRLTLRDNTSFLLPKVIAESYEIQELIKN